MTGLEPSDLAVSVERALMNDKAYQPHWKIDIVAENGRVTLGGGVPRPEDGQKVEAIARQQEGVISIIDEMDVDPGLQRHPEEQDLLEDKLEVRVPPTDMSPLAGPS